MWVISYNSCSKWAGSSRLYSHLETQSPLSLRVYFLFTSNQQEGKESVQDRPPLIKAQPVSGMHHFDSHFIVTV